MTNIFLTHYVYYYSIGSTLFLLITIIFYFTKKHIPDKKDKIYKWMLIMSLLAVVCDAFSALMENNTMLFPKWLLYLDNMLFIIGMHTCLALFLWYLKLFTNLQLPKLWYIIGCIPYMFIIIGLFLSPFGKFGIFYIDDAHIYQDGLIHISLYIITCLYFLIAIVILLLKRRIVRKVTKIALLSAIILVLLMVLTQMVHSNYLLTTSATAIGVTIMYYVVQLPSQYLDSSTATYNRVALFPLIDEMFSSKNDFTILMFSISSLDQINNLRGTVIEDNIIEVCANKLVTLFPKSYVCRMYYNDFVIITNGAPQTIEYYDNLLTNFDIINVSNRDIPLHTGLIVINGKDFKHTSDAITFLDFAIFEKLVIPRKTSFIDSNEIVHFNTLTNLTLDFRRLMNQDKVDIALKEVRNNQKQVFACEVIPYFDEPNYRKLTINDLIEASRDSNSTLEFLERVFTKIREHYKDLSSYMYINIRLPYIFFNYDNSCVRIDEYFSDIASKICFIFDEMDYAIMTTEALNNLTILRKKGYHIIIDNFGVGYTNSNTLLYLNLLAVMVNIKTLTETMTKDTIKSFLSLISGVTKEIKTYFMCSGVRETDFDLLNETDVDYFEIDDIVYLKK